MRAEDAQELAERWCTCAAWTFWRREPWAPAVPLTSGEREVWAADLMHLPGAVAVRTRDGMPLVTVARLVTGTWRRLSPVWSHLLAADDHPLSVLGLQLWHATHRSAPHHLVASGAEEAVDRPADGLMSFSFLADVTCAHRGARVDVECPAAMESPAPLGERHDLNARGGRIADLDGLREFIAELLDQGVISASDAESLALQIEAL